MKLKTLLIAMLLCAIQAAFAQENIWKTLEDVEFKRQYFEAEREYFLTPVFGAKVRELEGQIISVRGYILPVDFENDVQILSAFPFASCYFCGGAGPESVMEVHLRTPENNLQPDQIVTFKGRLKLNDNDIEMMNYILEDAVLVR